jgi:DNA-binding response OmpR family regulator
LSCVLVVEDRPEVLAVLTRSLLTHDFEVVKATSAEQAMDLWDQSSPTPDLLLTDYNLPGDDGVALAKRLREMRPGLPVLIISGLGGDPELHTFVDSSEGVEYLPKPFPTQSLVARLRKLLES